MTAGPWRRSVLVVAITGNLLGLLGILAAWYGASGEVTLEGQVRWLNLGVIAVVLAGVATAALLRDARIRVTDETRRVLVRASVVEQKRPA